MKKIPVKIVQYTISGETKKNVMIDMLDTYDIEGDVEKKLKDFKEKYFDLVEKAQRIIPKEKSEKKALFYWKVGNLFSTFNKNVKNEFEITNYNSALQRDFGLSSRYVRELMIFSELFSEKEVDDFIPMAIYRALVWKKTQLEEVGELKKEKTRLLKRGKNKEFVGRENYKKELNALVKSKKKVSVRRT